MVGGQSGWLAMPLIQQIKVWFLNNFSLDVSLLTQYNNHWTWAWWKPSNFEFSDGQVSLMGKLKYWKVVPKLKISFYQSTNTVLSIFIPCSELLPSRLASAKTRLGRFVSWCGEIKGGTLAWKKVLLKWLHARPKCKVSKYQKKQTTYLAQGPTNHFLLPLICLNPFVFYFL